MFGSSIAQATFEVEARLPHRNEMKSWEDGLGGYQLCRCHTNVYFNDWMEISKVCMVSQQLSLFCILVEAILWTRQRRLDSPMTAPSVTSSSQCWGSLWPAATSSIRTLRTCSKLLVQTSTNRSLSVMGCLKIRATSSIWKGFSLWRRTHQGLSLCTVCCTRTPRGAPLWLLFKATAPFSSSSPSCLGIWKARGDQCFVLDREAAVFCYSSDRSLLVLLGCCAVRFGTLSSCVTPGPRPMTFWRRNMVLTRKQLSLLSFAGNQLSFVNVACKCIAILIECTLTFELLPAFHLCFILFNRLYRPV